MRSRIRTLVPVYPSQRRLIAAALFAAAFALFGSQTSWFAGVECNVPLLGVTIRGSRMNFTGLGGTFGVGAVRAVLFGVAVPVAAVFAAIAVLVPGSPKAYRRGLLIAALLVEGVLLHLAVCEWSFFGRPGRGPGLLETRIDPNTYVGVFAKAITERVTACVLGLILPLGLILLAPYLRLAWRASDRRLIGHCVRCGQPPATPNASICAECGGALGG